MDFLIIILLMVFFFSGSAKKMSKGGSTNRNRAGGQAANSTPSSKPIKLSVQVTTKAAHDSTGHDHVKQTTMQPSEGMSQSYVPLHAQVGQRIQSRMESMEGYGAYQGSLGVDSAEGRDLCDSDLGHDRELEFSWRESAYTSDIGVVPEMDAQAMARAVVMSEILKRPSERKWGRL